MYSLVTPELVAKIFPLTPEKNIRENLPAVLDALQSRNCDRVMLLMALATIRAETGSFLPLEEGISRFNTPPGGPPFSLYDHRSSLGNLGPPDGERFRGRGYVQLTGRFNYAKFGKQAGVDLLARPELATQRDTAASLLVLFLQNNEPEIHSALAKNDWAAARRLVNGGTNGLAQFTEAYRRAADLIPG